MWSHLLKKKKLFCLLCQLHDVFSRGWIQQFTNCLNFNTTVFSNHKKKCPNLIYWDFFEDWIGLNRDSQAKLICKKIWGNKILSCILEHDSHLKLLQAVGGQRVRRNACNAVYSRALQCSIWKLGLRAVCMSAGGSMCSLGRWQTK